ncbi:MAG TPA: DUF1801 domain-containing protein [Candidatus Paceibacterota bacterium]|nr:DUF1801 domain-containing protein [Candidatus Paceibacterota bacterium]
MAELKTTKNKGSVVDFLSRVPDEARREDAKELLKIMREVTGEKPVMWGSSIVGFGEYHYESERSSQKGNWPLTGFSPRKQNLTIYIMPGFAKYGALLNKLGKHKTSVGCLYLNRLADAHIPTLKRLIKRGYDDMKKRHGAK